MPEHRIRLRGAWDRSPIESPDGPTSRVDLPFEGPIGRCRLARKFGRPPFDPAVESLRLDLADLPGLIRASLNGSDLPWWVGGGPAWSIPIDGPLPGRNVLILEVDFAGPVAPWGSISLVIGPKT